MSVPRAVDGVVIELIRIAQPGPVVAVHGGVDMEPVPATYATLAAAAARGFAGIEVDPEDGVGAAVLAVGVLEDDPAFNAGYGAVLNRAGAAETDGAVSDGATGRSVGVGAAPGIRNPAALARLLLRERNVVLLVGDGVTAYATANGIEAEDLVTDEQRAALAELGDDDQQSVFTGRRMPTETVGALVIDARDRVSSASSTGGLVGKLPGRVGDSCVAGAGFWTDERFGVLCSGSGEAAISRQLARRAADNAHRMGLVDGVTAALADLVETTGATAAIVVIDSVERQVVTVHNGASFPVVVRTSGSVQRLGDVSEAAS